MDGAAAMAWAAVMAAMADVRGGGVEVEVEAGPAAVGATRKSGGGRVEVEVGAASAGANRSVAAAHAAATRPGRRWWAGGGMAQRVVWRLLSLP